MHQKVIAQHIQDCFVLLAITDVDFLRLARHAVPAKYFSSQVTEDIITICYAYFDQFGEPAKNHLSDELSRFLLKVPDEKAERYYKYVQRVQALDPPTREYVLHAVSQFIQAREIEGFLMDACPLAERGQFEKVKELLRGILHIGVGTEDDGIEYPANWPPSYQQAGTFKEIVCPIGIPYIDQRIGGLRRSSLTSIFAGYKVGKTWACIQIATQALLAGRNVLELSHEATAEEVEMRHDMMLGSLIDNQEDQMVDFTEYDDEGNKTGVHPEMRKSVYDEDAVRKVRARIRKFGGKSIIKKYPMGTCSIGEVERYLDHLEASKKFVPDLLISDYVEKMKMSDSSEGRDQINKTYINLKRIADERNIAVLTASQIKTNFLESAMVSEAGAPAEDARKLGNIDLGLFFGMTRAQAQRQVMQAYVLVNRSGPQKFGCVVARNLNVGQLTLDCWPIKFDNDES